MPALLAIFAWTGGTKAFRLAYTGSAGQLARRSRKLYSWAVYSSLAALIGSAAIILLAVSHAPVFWIDRLTLHVPFELGTAAAIWLVAVPRLRRLRQAARAADGALPHTLRAEAAAPGIVIPFHAAALGGLAGLFYALVPPVPVRTLPVIVPVLIYVLALGALYVRHVRRWRQICEADVLVRRQPWSRFVRFIITVSIVGAIAAAGIWAGLENSKLPARISMTAGEMDWGGGAEPGADAAGLEEPAHHAVTVHTAHQGHVAESAVNDGESEGAIALASGSSAGGDAVISVSELTGPQQAEADRTFTLTAERQDVKLATGETVKGAWTFNGQLPGPELRMREGELIEVKLVNRDLEEGVTIHWHGLDVPNAEDGVAGVTQNAVMPGQSYTYRFIAEQTGTFWYHSHQDSQEAVSKGLFGPLVVEPADKGNGESEKDAVQKTGDSDIIVMSHVWDGVGFAVGDSTGVQQRTVTPGTEVRLRLINTQDWVRQKYTLIGAPFRVAAIDGTDVNEPELLNDKHIELTTGGRMDLVFKMPDTPVFLAVGQGSKLGIAMSPDGQNVVPGKLPKEKTSAFNPIHYGKAAATSFNADRKFDREFTMVLDNKLGFYNGTLNQLYTINGKVFPDTPMYMVREGDLVRTTIVNRGSVDHPMHLHGHHVLVLSRNGVKSDGSPWWSDTLDVLPGDTYEIAFVADNPGLWMDHCHNLTHAVTGMSMHLMYEGITSPYEVGSDTLNHPE